MRWKMGVILAALFAGQMAYWAWQTVGPAVLIILFSAIGLYLIFLWQWRVNGS
jgi:hypothetical protein